MKFILILICFFALTITYGQKNESEIIITELLYKDLPHFRVETSRATWLISRESGGCTSLFDKDGNDWINNSRTGNHNPTNSADSDYRGLPNLVFRGEDDGVGHPSGIGVCNVVQTGNSRLEVTSNSGLWKFSWTFFDHYAAITIEKTDTSRKYWFLYEGPVAGKFNPYTHYWGTDADGLRTDRPVLGMNAVTGSWQWAYFGDYALSR